MGKGGGDLLVFTIPKVCDARLVTFNEKHFPMLDDIIVPY